MRWLPLAALVLTAGCDVCPVNTVETDKFAPVTQFHDDIVACANQHDCDRLCTDVFQLGPDDSLESCAITQLEADGGTVHVRYTEAQTCGDDGDTVVVTTGGDDDGSSPPPSDPCSDGSCNPPPSDPCSDGSCNPPPDNGGDDGTTDDGGGDDGGDDGDDTPHRKPTAPLTHSAR